jgi:hypothetical protein
MSRLFGPLLALAAQKALWLRIVDSCFYLTP